MSREQKIAATFVELADTLVADFDVIDFLQQLTVRCRDIFAVADVAVLLGYPGPQLYSPAPCDPSPTLAAVLDLALGEGPACEAYRTASVISPGNLATAPASWGDFTAQAREAGYTYASAVPMRLREDTLGSVLLLRATDSPLPADDLVMAQAFADAATIGLLHARALKDTEAVNAQLHTALHSRITIEQAKGFLAAHRNTSLDDAFAAMRGHARSHRLLLTAVARHVVDTGDLPLPPAASPHHHPAEG
ncbi:transcriptional regulator [Streptomyces venezuelae]|uniref:Transcriptional regulator n=1 Tax=Streptomyces venezuelae TaxID=54571 RepID=A0A5P2CPI8_STRVZ|nr:GAF and ANTAR domain-containing protein [Streptomyces venezuelae]QES44755.1 transcriptional regulator [Streptomyces venezuelae]